ncbi:MAG: CDP-alcohol phosphatidyltransferase family protein [Verrucomicrobiales bacterium]|nr:CDP-alcohol phosphatidyltransferase family protein [Verrucomicrobiales bacterium]
MTTANKITIFRFLLIPVFVTFSLYYSQSIQEGAENVGFRIAALAAFALAAISDALDGFIARRFNQSTPLGKFLDPLADKMLLLAGVLTLSLTGWYAGLPIWFGVLVIARDAMIMLGWVIIRNLVGHVKMNPILTSKICTFLQLSCVCWVLLDFWSKEPPLGLNILIYAAAAFTVISGVQYVREGSRQLRVAGHTEPDKE